MRRVCAWCKKELPSGEEPQEDGLISHGICSICAIDLTNYERRKTGQILNYLQEPVILVDRQGVVRAANEQAEKLLGKSIENIENMLGGDAFECAYAARPGGCGRTEHCATCAIRNTIMDTLASGEGFSRVPAYQRLRTADGEKTFRFIVTTQKIKDTVMLRIDAVAEV